ncbi:MAG: hypothetical protein GEU88_00945 [Solirubrobacterales bacterium]|nr:hypothetical protein [Solirubrobacterales bacterium]
MARSAGGRGRKRKVRRAPLGRLGAGVAAAALLAVGVAACGGDDESEDVSGGERQEVTMVIPLPESISFVGLSVAQERFYPEEGLEVDTPPPWTAAARCRRSCSPARRSTRCCAPTR